MHRSSLKRHCWPIKQKNLVKFQLYGDLISLNGKVDVFGLFGFFNERCSILSHVLPEVCVCGGDRWVWVSAALSLLPAPTPLCPPNTHRACLLILDQLCERSPALYHVPDGNKVANESAACSCRTKTKQLSLTLSEKPFKQKLQQVTANNY